MDYTNNGGPFKWLNKKLNKKRFTPTSSEISKVEEFLSNKNVEILHQLNVKKSGTNLITSLDVKKYYRQYFGYLDNGRKVVHIRFYDKNDIVALKFNWKTQSIDGYGWFIVLDIEKNAILDGFIYNSPY